MDDDTTPLPRRGIIAPADDSDWSIPGRLWAVPRANADGTPPPAPVLPASERSATIGRRFSADDLPDDFQTEAPRRSASSPTPFGMSPADPPVALTYDYGAQPAEAIAPEARQRPFHVRWFWPVVAVAVVAALVLGWTLISRYAKPAVPGGTATDRASMLARPDDVAALRAGTTWSATDDIAPDESKGIRCVLPSAQGPVPVLEGSLVRRTLSATSGDPAGVVQQVETYADADAAARAFAARAAQIGGCAATPDLVTKGYAVTGLGDQSVAVEVTEQDAAAVAHDLVVVRTGNALLITDVRAGKTALPMEAVASSLVPTLNRLCGPAKGTCPSTPAVQGATPPAGEFPGSLATGDLPLVNPGIGAWVGAEIKPMKLTGSGCEGADLMEPPGVVSAVQHAYLLTGDSGSPAHFGLDEIVYTFPSPTEASVFVTRITTKLDGCAAQQSTATVTAGAKLAAPASGQLFTVDQRKTLDKAARSRIVVGAEGAHVVYLIGNPTEEFDLSDAEWLAVAQRAVSRASQLP